MLKMAVISDESTSVRRHDCSQPGPGPGPAKEVKVGRPTAVLAQKPTALFAKWLLDPTRQAPPRLRLPVPDRQICYAGGRFAPAMDRDGRPGWLPSLGFAFLSFNCGMAVYRSWDDPSSVAFVVVAYVALIFLFRCLHLLEGAAPGRQGRSLKAAVWGLSTLLTLMFSSKVAAIMPLWGQLLVWAMGIFTVVAGFYAFFLARPEQP